MDPLIMLVIAVFIITGVFVGYHAAQESHEEIAEGHNALTEIKSLNNQIKEITYLLVLKQI